MRPLPVPARIRIAYECAVEKRIELAIQRMMEQPITHARLMDIARFRITDSKMFIAAMLVLARNEIVMESDNVVHQMSREFLHIFSVAFPLYEFFPSGKQILKRDDSVIGTRINTP